MKEYDVAIIGAGSAGLSARREVAKVTQNYVVIDDGPLGTTCARVGCMPSKVLIQVANDFHRRHKFSELGIQVEGEISIDHKKVMSHVRKLRDRFVRGVTTDLEEWISDHLIQQRAHFVDQNTLDLGDEKIKAKKIIVATGSKPVVPGAWSDYQKYFITTDEFFEMETLPKKVAVIGLGVIGVELGQALSRLGVEVIGFTADKSIGALSDPAIQNYAADSFEKEFDIHYGLSDIVGEENGQLLVKSGDTVVAVDRAFLTMGRAPNLKSLKLENTGIDLDGRGVPSISKTTFNAEGSSLFFAGDITGERGLLHEASDEGRIAGYNSVREKNECFRRRELLAVTFSEPNIGLVGKSYAELKQEGHDFVTGTVSYEGQGRAIVMLQEEGLLHVYADKNTGKVLGAELFAPHGEHLAHLIAWVVNLNLTVFEVLSMPFYHPVLEEGLRTAFRSLASQVAVNTPPLEVLRCEDPPAGNRC